MAELLTQGILSRFLFSRRPGAIGITKPSETSQHNRHLTPTSYLVCQTDNSDK